MTRQDPERNDPGDSSAVSDSMEIKHQSTKIIKKEGHDRMIDRSNFRSPNNRKTEVMMQTTSTSDSKTSFKVSLINTGFEH